MANSEDDKISKSLDYEDQLLEEDDREVFNYVFDKDFEKDINLIEEDLLLDDDDDDDDYFNRISKPSEKNFKYKSYDNSFDLRLPISNSPDEETLNIEKKNLKEESENETVNNLDLRVPLTTSPLDEEISNKEENNLKESENERNDSLKQQHSVIQSSDEETSNKEKENSKEESENESVGNLDLRVPLTTSLLDEEISNKEENNLKESEKRNDSLKQRGPVIKSLSDEETYTKTNNLKKFENDYVSLDGWVPVTISTSKDEKTSNKDEEKFKESENKKNVNLKRWLSDSSSDFETPHNNKKKLNGESDNDSNISLDLRLPEITPPDQESDIDSNISLDLRLPEITPPDQESDIDRNISLDLRLPEITPPDRESDIDSNVSLDLRFPDITPPDEISNDKKNDLDIDEKNFLENSNESIVEVVAVKIPRSFSNIESINEKSMIVENEPLNVESESVIVENEPKVIEEEPKVTDKTDTSVNTSPSSQSLPRKTPTTNQKLLWIANVPKNTKANELKQLLSAYGKVNCVKIVVNTLFPGSCCFGCVTMGSVEDVDEVIKNLNNTEFNGQIIKIVRFEQRLKAFDTLPKTDKAENINNRNETVNTQNGNKDKDKLNKNEERESNEEKKLSEVERTSDSERTESRSSNRSSRCKLRSTPPTRKRHSESSKGFLQEVLTFKKIKAERERQKLHDGERAIREETRRRREEAMRAHEMRATEHRQRIEAERLHREREKLRHERDRIEHEKTELLKLERERQRIEHEKLQMERMELQRSCMRLEQNHRGIKRPGTIYKSFEEHNLRFEPPPLTRRNRDYETERLPLTSFRSYEIGQTRINNTRYIERPRSPHFRTIRSDNRILSIPESSAPRTHYYANTSEIDKFHRGNWNSNSATSKQRKTWATEVWERPDQPNLVSWEDPPVTSPLHSRSFTVSSNSNMTSTPICPPPPGIHNYSDRYTYESVNLRARKY